MIYQKELVRRVQSWMKNIEAINPDLLVQIFNGMDSLVAQNVADPNQVRVKQ
jgi:hypothetical protein